MSPDSSFEGLPEANRKMIVTIDGPAGAGKSTIARHLARHFGLLNLETGAMYRAFALKALRADVPLNQAKALEELAAETSIRLEAGDAENRVFVDGEDVTGLIRNPAVTDAASRVSVHPAIRAWMVKLQQQLGAARDSPVAFSQPQTLTRRMYCNQRRRAGGAHDPGRSVKVVKIRYSCRHHVRRAVDHQMSQVVVRTSGGRALHVCTVAGADEDTSALSGEVLLTIASTIEEVVAQLE